MTHTAVSAGRRWTIACLLTLLTLILYAPCANAQSESADAKPTTAAEPQEYRTYYLVNASQPAENDITTDLRNMLPRAKIYLVNSLGAITIRGSADDLQLAQRIIADIDRPAKTYLLTFTLNDRDADKAAGSRRIAMVIVVGGKSEVKQGGKIPIVVGAPDTQSTVAANQVQYEDIGLNIEAWLDTAGDALRLRTKVEQSSVSDEKSNVGIQDPVLHQTVFEGTSNIVEGRPLVLGTLGSPGGAGSEEIEVVAEPVK